MKEIEINGIKETIIERSDYPIEECKKILRKENGLLNRDTKLNDPEIFLLK